MTYTHVEFWQKNCLNMEKGYRQPVFKNLGNANASK